MTARIANPHALAPEQLKPMVALEQSFAASGLDPVLLELVKLRVSQINGCAFCIEMHTHELKKLGMEEIRVHMVAGWRESTRYSAREKAALGWAESLTRLAETRAPDADYAPFAEAFDEVEQVRLSFAIGAINLWNRLQVGFRVVPAGEALRAAA